jgi:hypothetical protein
MTRQSVWLISMILAFCCATKAEAQEPGDSITADQAIAYINAKVKGRTTSTDSTDVRVDGVKLKGSVFVMDSTRTVKLSGLGSTTSFVEDEIDLTQVKDFTPFQTAQLLQEDRHLIDLSCGNGHGECAMRITCAATSDGKCGRLETKRTPGFYFETLATDRFDEEKRVKKAMVYLKSLFPYKENIELFDKK